ncbi:hypothetical protein PPERSA_01965 [Pseudocohnilembus persalinus]|uniref:Uncharacterized protein n=1 Tax=Pseudocohnilembus persalinus TaxID=266149 RepID=A0A0V0R3I9_PSEPJ|nr:hypothetical protein PPERSA_01965 [Pseudocohnilembus persalinus]|eukprot:KRX09078.1 hypothetical protein PPERSA_01965 [Pseudocohnilembus persalinus]
MEIEAQKQKQTDEIQQDIQHKQTFRDIILCASDIVIDGFPISFGIMIEILLQTVSLHFAGTLEDKKKYSAIGLVMVLYSTCGGVFLNFANLGMEYDIYGVIIGLNFANIFGFILIFSYLKIFKLFPKLDFSQLYENFGQFTKECLLMALPDQIDVWCFEFNNILVVQFLQFLKDQLLH